MSGPYGRIYTRFTRASPLARVQMQHRGVEARIGPNGYGNGAKRGRTARAFDSGEIFFFLPPKESVIKPEQ